MKNILIYFILIIILNNCTNVDFSELNKKFRRKREIEYYDNGCKKHSISYFNNKFDGPMIRWNNNCDIISETNYENGMIHGHLKEYYPDGKIMHYVEYFYGQKNGVDRWYYDNGNLKSELVYEYDTPISETSYWDRDGNKLY